MNTDPGSRGSIALLPDTQFYSRYGAEGNNQYAKQYPGIPNPFESQSQWIVDNSGNYGISMTQHLGDVVDQVNHPEQWDVASKAMAIMDEARAPYAVIPGNHDCSDCNPSWTVPRPRRLLSISRSFRCRGSRRRQASNPLARAACRTTTTSLSRA